MPSKVLLTQCNVKILKKEHNAFNGIEPTLLRGHLTLKGQFIIAFKHNTTYTTLKKLGKKGMSSQSAVSDVTIL